MGRYGQFDAYFCPAQRTVLARFGDAASAWVSSPIGCALRSDTSLEDKAHTVLVRLARYLLEEGFIDLAVNASRIEEMQAEGSCPSEALSPISISAPDPTLERINLA
jgi:hypothetical protein